MGKSLLSIISENERNRIRPKNLDTPTDDVQKSSYKEYATGYGIFSGVDYTRDKNEQALNVNEVGDRVLSDLKDLNVFPQDDYVRVNTDLNDVSVIDMPEIEEISEDIYLNQIIYNKFASLEYIPYEIELPVGVLDQQNSYGEYIEKIKQNLEIRGTNLADYFTGDFNLDDSPIGIIGGNALNVLLNEQVSFNLKRETLGRINNPVWSVIQNEPLIRPDYDVTVNPNGLAAAAEFLINLQGGELPFSYLPQDLFGLERRAVVDNGRVTYVGSNMSFEERLELTLRYTGKGQQQQLFNLVKLNLYNPLMIGTDETLLANDYISYIRGVDINAKDFIVTLGNSKPTGRGYYEPYGVVSINKQTARNEMISDGFAWKWIEDIQNDDAVGWTRSRTLPIVGSVPQSNNYNPKSLLYKTQDIVLNNSNAFIDMNAKEFVESVNGENLIISRGDSTTASGSRVYDDGTFINKGEYFRVWTKKRGYNRLSRTLRHRGLDNGDTRSVLNDNGIPNYAPTLRTASKANGFEFDDIIKRYMFSIENLAWNDNMDDLPYCEQGVGDPVTGTRGRIMWFPPYNLKIDESVTVNWNESNFIGRGEPIWTYNNTKRSATLSWTIIVDHPDIVHTLVGQKSEYWERYFKGDKLIEEDAIAKQLINKKLSQNEIDEIEKQRKRLQPIEKNDDTSKVTERKKEEDDNEEVVKKEETGEFGKLVNEIYFPNEVTDVPVPAVIVKNGEVLNTPQSFGILNNNAGYECPFNFSPEFYITQGIDANKLKGGDNNDVEIKTVGGLRYRGSINNQVYTYVKGKLRTPASISKSVNNSKCPNGYTDNTNFGLNGKWYNDSIEIIGGNFISSNLKIDNTSAGVDFDKINIIKDLIKSGSGDNIEWYKNAEITLIGNASAATTSAITNKKLAQNRAESAKSFFEKVFLPVLRSAGFTTELKINTDAKGDSEDVEGRDNPQNILPNGDIINVCKECDQPDLEPCKKSRRVDVYVKVLDEIEETPEVAPTGDTTIDEEIENGNLTPDQDEINVDPDDQNLTPPIDPSIIKKLVYTECDFFKYLEINEPIAYQTISERIKYFWAAYHSITPQGFNSRLTFLHQCTRQGDSLGRDGVNNWKNLAFGRPPVCILRIGDFYHTRMIIKDMSITYSDNITWDLNPEGIGVQPMFVDIKLGIEILGGSSMTAPINRLQNALSFNYYANTEMYDARADSVVFIDRQDGEGNTDENATFGTVKNGQIVDGIKLSSITNFSDSEKQERLAKLRRQSRVTLPNSTTADADISNSGALSGNTVASLLEVKKRLGLALTTDEKTTLIVDESVNKNLSTTEITPIVQREISVTFDTFIKDENSALTQSVEQLNESGIETDREIVYDLFDVYFPSEDITDDDKSKMLDAYQEALKAQQELIKIE